MRIILASTSPYRKAILDSLGLPFAAAKPDIDETPKAGETPRALTARLSLEKAAAIQAPDDAFVIGSDQAAVIDGDILGKPHTAENAIAQLQRFSGRSVEFLTGLTVKKGARSYTCVEPFTVHFRHLSQAEIEHYVAREQPLNCAGSFKSEGLGILLFSHLAGRDPNALIGLPVIALRELFACHGVNLLTQPFAAPPSPSAKTDSPSA